MKLPTLYKKTSTGAIQEWSVEATTWSGGELWGVVRVTHGQVGGKLQVSEDIIKVGKNIGKSNETNADKQAALEAHAKWEKQKKKGYVTRIADAEAGKVDAVIEGGVVPMLAHRFDEQGHKIVFPAFVQPKFDGHRCIAVTDADGKVTLWSRTRKLITGLPHINEALEKLARETVTRPIFDGELYNHDYRNRFEDLTSFIRNPEPQDGSEVIEYHIYDVVAPDYTFADRLSCIKDMQFKSPLVAVETRGVEDEDEMFLAFESFLAQGYEGLMVRNARGRYLNKRSYDLQKVKEMMDSEYPIVGVEAGRGKMADKAIFICRTAEGTDFRVKMKGSLDALKKYIDDPSLAINKMLTVQYQGITGAAAVPRFPVGLRLREDI